MVSDHPTENDTTDLPLPSEPAAPLSDAAGEEVSVPLPSPVPTEVEGRPGGSESATPALGVESGIVPVGVQAAEVTAQPADDGGGAAADAPEVVNDAAEVVRDEVQPAAGTGGAPQEAGEGHEEVGRAIQEASEDRQEVGEVSEEVGETAAAEELKKEWYILKVQVNREDSIREALLRRVKIEGLEPHFGDIIVPTEEVAEFNKSGKRRVVRRKLYPGYILVHMAINDDTWFVVRETPGVGDFTGSAGKPTPMEARDVERILRLGAAHEERGGPIKTAIPFKSGDRVRVKDGHFQNFEGEVDAIDEANGRVTVMINIFNRSTPVELEHWQVESV